MIFRPRYAALILLATAVAFSTSASAGKFGAPVALSFNGHAATVSVAVDAAGNALAARADAGMYYGTRPAGGAWSAPQSVYVGGAFPRDARDARRAATIVSYSNGAGIWSVDRPQGGSWSAPALVVSTPEIVSSVIDNVSPVQFLMNANGGQAIVFQQWVGSDVVITAVRRPAGGAWSEQDNVASSATYGDIAIASSPRTNCRRSERRPQESLTGNSCGSGRLLRDLSRAHAHLRDAPPRERLARALECAVALGARDVLAATVGEIPGLVSVVRVLASDLEAPGFNTVTVLGRRTLQAMLEAAEAAR